MIFEQINQEPDGFEVLRQITPPGPCSYLPNYNSELEFRYIVGLSSRSYEKYLQRGWRRFGHAFFRPVCSECRECRPIRIPVNSLTLSKSQKRNLKKNDEVRLEIGRPAASQQVLSLYQKYHKDMTARRKWPDTEADPEEFYESFVAGANDFGYEFRYYHDKNLVGVGYVDILANSFSSVYFFYDPEYRKNGLGVYSVLKEIEQARRTGRDHLYLGYWIKDNDSMNYKNRYKPHQFLQQFVPLGVKPEWGKNSAAPESFAV